jgi:hypothetical protein
MHSGSAAQSIDFEARVVGYDQFSGDGQAVGFCFLARVRLEGCAVFYDGRQRRKVWDVGHGHVVAGGGSGEIAEFTGIRGGEEDCG